MVEGYNWNEQAAFAALDRILTKEEWDYIQGEIDIINDLWPQIEEMERRINGIAPPKVEALPIVTRHGTYNGGYYPLVADSTQNPEIERRKGKSERSEEHTSELQSLMRISYAVFCLKKNKMIQEKIPHTYNH